MTPTPDRPLSAWVPHALRHPPDGPMTPWLAVADAMWRASRPGLDREPDGEAGLAALAERYGWGGLLAAAGGVGRCANPERLRRLPALADRVGADNLIVFWLECVFGLDVRVADGARDQLPGAEVGPPVVVIDCSTSSEDLALVDRDALQRVLEWVVPAHLAYRLNPGGVGDEPVTSG